VRKCVLCVWDDDDEEEEDDDAAADVAGFVVSVVVVLSPERIPLLTVVRAPIRADTRCLALGGKPDLRLFFLPPLWAGSPFLQTVERASFPIVVTRVGNAETMCEVVAWLLQTKVRGEVTLLVVYFSTSICEYYTRTQTNHSTTQTHTRH